VDTLALIAKDVNKERTPVPDPGSARDCGPRLLYWGTKIEHTWWNLIGV
jgi:hypothetical protein